MSLDVSLGLQALFLAASSELYSTGGAVIFDLSDGAVFGVGDFAGSRNSALPGDAPAASAVGRGVEIISLDVEALESSLSGV